MSQAELACFSLVLWNMLEKYHHDPEPVFRAAGLDHELMQKPGARYSLKKTDILWQEASKCIKDPCFALSAAECWHPSNFSTLGYTLLASTTIRESFELTIRFIRVLSDLSIAEMHDDTTQNIFTFSVIPGKQYSFPNRMVAVLAIIVQLIRMNYQKPLAPSKVTFTHSAPECANKYYEFFQSPIYFESPVTSMSLPLDLVDTKLPGANDQLVKMGKQVLMQHKLLLDQTGLSRDLKKVLMGKLPSGDVSLKSVASDLRKSSRTLQRLLKQNGTSFNTLLDETRRELAMQYVKNRNMDIAEIAFLLGFSDQSTLSRAFKRWTGRSPRQFRNEPRIPNSDN